MKNRVLLQNAICVILCWSIVNFNFYFLNFSVKYLKGDVFVNQISFSSADIIACFSCGFIAKYVGTKRTLFSCFLIAGVFAVICVIF